MNPMNYFKSGLWKQTAKVIGKRLVEVRPEIMLITGGLSLLAGTIYACVKTPEAKKVIDATKELVAAEENLDEICNRANNSEPNKEEKIKRGKKWVRIYGKAGLHLLQIYAVPGLLWVGGFGCIAGAHKELRTRNTRLIANSVAMQRLFSDYRKRNAAAIGEEAENRIYMGTQEGMVKVIEKDPETGEEKIVQKKADVFVAQGGSIFARNFTAATSDAFDIRSYADYFLESRIESINKDLELGLVKFLSGADIFRRLGFNESEIDENLIDNGISGNARKVTNPEMRKLKVTRMLGYEKKRDIEHDDWIYEECLRLDFNFYPLKGLV
jgi:hypothetical protein